MLFGPATSRARNSNEIRQLWLQEGGDHRDHVLMRRRRRDNHRRGGGRAVRAVHPGGGRGRRPRAERRPRLRG